MNPSELEPDEIKAAVRGHYAERVKNSGGCCSAQSSATAAQSMGYSASDLESIPGEANLGVGCGNPVGLASLQAGHHVLDLGSGAGIDCFLAAQQVGSQGLVVGVDMLIEMITRARTSAKNQGLANVEFRLGEIECLPVETGTMDVILSIVNIY